MTDTFEVTGEFAPAENFSAPLDNSLDTTSSVEAVAEVVEAAADVPEAPNGFVELGLAHELVMAVKDLGYTQPTTVQMKTIPLALPKAVDGQKAGYIDLMVSSQTGSGKTAAFLLPVLHTCLLYTSDAADE